MKENSKKFEENNAKQISPSAEFFRVKLKIS
jgi:hypothetical protein